MSAPRFTEPVAPADAMDGIKTLAGPIKTLRDNFANGLLQTSNKTITIEALDMALDSMRIAYKSIQRSAGVSD